MWLFDNKKNFNAKQTLDSFFSHWKVFKVVSILIIILWFFYQWLKIVYFQWKYNIDLLSYFSYTNSINDFIYFLWFILLSILNWLSWAIISFLFLWVFNFLLKLLILKYKKLDILMNHKIQMLLALFFLTIIFIIIYFFASSLNIHKWIFAWLLWLAYLTTIFIYSFYFKLKIKTWLLNIWIFTYIIISFFLLLLFPDWKLWCTELVSLDNYKNINNNCYELRYINDRYWITVDNKVIKIDEFKAFYKSWWLLETEKEIYKKLSEELKPKL